MCGGASHGFPKKGQVEEKVNPIPSTRVDHDLVIRERYKELCCNSNLQHGQIASVSIVRIVTRKNNKGLNSSVLRLFFALYSRPSPDIQKGKRSMVDNHDRHGGAASGAPGWIRSAPWYALLLHTAQQAASFEQTERLTALFVIHLAARQDLGILQWPLRKLESTLKISLSALRTTLHKLEEQDNPFASFVSVQRIVTKGKYPSFKILVREWDQDGLRQAYTLALEEPGTVWEFPDTGAQTIWQARTALPGGLSLSINVRTVPGAGTVSERVEADQQTSESRSDVERLPPGNGPAPGVWMILPQYQSVVERLTALGYQVYYPGHWYCFIKSKTNEVERKVVILGVWEELEVLLSTNPRSFDQYVSVMEREGTHSLRCPRCSLPLLFTPREGVYRLARNGVESPPITQCPVCQYVLICAPSGAQMDLQVV